MHYNITIKMWKILKHWSLNEARIRFFDPPRNGTRANVPGLNRSSSQRNWSLFPVRPFLFGRWSSPQLEDHPSDIRSIADPHYFKVNLINYLLNNHR